MDTILSNTASCYSKISQHAEAFTKVYKFAIHKTIWKIAATAFSEGLPVQ